MKAHVDGSDGLLQAGTVFCGPAPFKGNPRSVLPPPEKNSCPIGTWLPPVAASRPIRRLLAQTMPPPICLYAAACARNFPKLTFEPRIFGFRSNSRLL